MNELLIAATSFMTVVLILLSAIGEPREEDEDA